MAQVNNLLLLIIDVSSTGKKSLPFAIPTCRGSSRLGHDRGPGKIARQFASSSTTLFYFMVLRESNGGKALHQLGIIRLNKEGSLFVELKGIEPSTS